MAAPAAAETFPAPDGAGTRGLKLWAQLGGAAMTDTTSRVLLEEACRVADRLERLDEILRGDTDAWMALRLPRDDASELILHIDSALAEARQQQAALQKLLTAIAPTVPPAAPKGPEVGGATSGGDFLDELAVRREADGRPAPPRRART